MIEIERARDLLSAAMQTQGSGFVYNPDGKHGCQYSPSSVRPETGCLVGVALNLAGEHRHRSFRGRVESFATKYPDVMTPSAAVYLQIAQSVQDLGGSWGEAVAAAERMATAYLELAW